MSSVIRFKWKELKQLASDKNSCVVEKTVAQNLALQPWCLGNIEESIKTLLDYKVWKYVKEFDGILLSYKNLRILQNVGTIRNDNAIYFPVKADYYIFKPYVGATLKGVVNKKSATHLGILVHRVFNVVIPRPTDEPGNSWIGTTIQENQEVLFKIVVLDLYGALPYIRGELDERWLKQISEDDETYELSSTKSIDVSYVDFDKIKPSQKHSSDKTVQPSKKKTGTNNCSTNSRGTVDSDAENRESAIKNEVSLQSKSKTKKHKLTDPDTKCVETNTISHKKPKIDD